MTPRSVCPYAATVGSLVLAFITIAVASAAAAQQAAPPVAVQGAEQIAEDIAVPDRVILEAADGRLVLVEQTPDRRPLAPVAQRERPYSISAHLQFGRLSQTASSSFNAILGTSSGQIFGGGAELTLRGGLFVRFDASYFSDEGERVEMIDGKIVPLGIPLRLSLTPIEISGGYRLHAYRFGRRGQARLVPFVGAGAGALRYHEETDASHPDENVTERFASYHLLLGLDVPLGRRVVIGAELTHRWVPGGLGSGGISKELGDTDLGGTTALTRVRIIIF